MKRTNLNFWKYLRTGLFCSLVVGAVACNSGTETVEDTEAMTEDTLMGENEADMDTWDNTRFSESFTSTGRFAGWDENGDKMLDQNEYNNSYFDTWDVNNDNAIDDDEWNTASGDFGVENQNMTDWDTNKDNKIDQDEFGTGSANLNTFGTLDQDGDKMLNEREYSDGIFGSWDNDDDGSITNDEYNTRYNRYYGGDM